MKSDCMTSLPRQAVYISNNVAKCFISARSVSTHMKFIDHLVIACPESMQENFRNTLKSLPFNVSILNELDLLNELTLPQDHAKRNSLLRQRLYRHAVISENFIAFDDDYIAIEDIDISYYLNNGIHTGYFHCDSKDIWYGDYRNPTSYDRVCWKTRKFLKDSGFDTKLYNSHMPQIINKRLVNIAYSYCTNMGLDEWSSYFNIAKFLVPNHFRAAYYCAAGWPQNPEEWVPPLPIKKALFLNYYPEDIKNNESYQDYSAGWVKNLNHHFTQDSVNILSEPPIVIVSSNGLDANVTELSCSKESKLKIWLEKQITTNIAYIYWTFGNHNFCFSYKKSPSHIYIPTNILKNAHLNSNTTNISINILDKYLRKISELSIFIKIR